MAGHSKWANIRHRKGAQDKKRGKIFTKIIKEITISSRLGGGAIDSNPRLRKAISNAKSNNMPADKIDRAIKKGSGELAGVVYDEITYEGYGPYGVAIMMDIITDNKNRSVAEIRNLLSKYGGNLGETGSVSWMFDKQGQIIISAEGYNEDTFLESVMEVGAIDFKRDNDIFILETTPETLLEIRNSLERDGFHILSAEIEMVAKSLQKLDPNQTETIIKLFDKLEDNDDVNKLYSNIDFV